MVTTADLSRLESDVEIPLEWLAEFEAAARRPLPQRIKYGFVKTYKPVLDDAEYRSWDSAAEYRQWCREKFLSGYVMVAFDYRQAERIRDAFAAYGVRCLFFGES